MPRKGLDFTAVLVKAAELADEKGLEGVSLGELAERLNVRPPSLYNHLDSLSALKQKLAIYGLNRLYERMIQAAVGRSGDEAVRAISEAYVAFARRHPGQYEATFRAPDTSDPELQLSQRQIVELSVQVLSVYKLKDDQALHAIRGLRSILHGFASIANAGGFGLPLDLNDSFRILIDTFLAGIHSQIK